MEIDGSHSFQDETLNASDNLSDSMVHGIQDPQFTVVFFILLLLSCLTVFANALILLAFYVEKSLRTYTNWYILNITIADLVVGLACMPLRATVHLYDGWHFGEVSSILFVGLQNSILSVSVCGVVVICMDRYIATFYPIKHFQRKSINKATLVNIFTWILSFGIWMMVTCAWTLINSNDTESVSGFLRPQYTKSKAGSVLVFALRFVLPFLLITGFYLRIYFRVKSVYSKRIASYLKKENSEGHGRITHGRKNNRRSNIQGNDMDAFDEPPQDKCDRKDTMFVNTEEAVVISSVSLSVTKSSERAKENNRLRNNKPYSVETQSMSESEEPPVEVIENRVGIFRDTMSKRFKRKSTTESRKAMRTLTFITLVFFVTWLPITGLVMVYSISPGFYNPIGGDVYLLAITRWISYCNSLVNPLA